MNTIEAINFVENLISPESNELIFQLHTSRHSTICLEPWKTFLNAPNHSHRAVFEYPALLSSLDRFGYIANWPEHEQKSDKILETVDEATEVIDNCLLRGPYRYTGAEGIPGEWLEYREQMPEWVSSF